MIIRKNSISNDLNSEFQFPTFPEYFCLQWHFLLLFNMATGFVWYCCCPRVVSLVIIIYLSIYIIKDANGISKNFKRPHFGRYKWTCLFIKSTFSASIRSLLLTYLTFSSYVFYHISRKFLFLSPRTFFKLRTDPNAFCIL